MGNFIRIAFFLCAWGLIAQPKYSVPINAKLFYTSVETAKQQVGETETDGPNDSPKIREWLKSANINFPAPYCAAGIYWTFHINKDYGVVPFAPTAVAISFLQQAKKHNNLKSYEPRFGDLIVWKHSKTWSGHVERIILVGDAGWVTTVGFNTSSGESGDQRDGEGVWQRRRNVLHPLGRMQVYGLVGFDIKDIDCGKKKTIR